MDKSLGIIEEILGSDLDNLPDPPSILYKYVSPARIDVLESRRIRFTPLLDTNDVFEVRQTFAKLAGPKFQALITAASDEADYDKAFSDAAMELGLPPALAVYARAQLGADLKALVKLQLLETITDSFIPQLNSQDNISQLLERVAGDLLVLSLSEDPHSTTMWAHYAENWTGFVIAFDTSNGFFVKTKSGLKTGLQPVKYFDTQFEELLDNPRAALISKTSGWSYEKEWRLSINSQQADEALRLPDCDLHFRTFESSAVIRVIVGYKASDSLIKKLKTVMSASFSKVELTQIRPIRFMNRLEEVQL